MSIARFIQVRLVSGVLALSAALALLCGIAAAQAAPEARGVTDRPAQRGLEPMREDHTLAQDTSAIPQALRVPNRLALCIGINGYDAASGYKPLEYAVADARALANAFTAVGFTTTVMVDDAEDESLRPTYENLDAQIFKFARQAEDPSSTVVITFAGHGTVLRGQSVVIPLDYKGQGSRPLTLGQILDSMGAANARNKLLIIDACRSASLGGRAQNGRRVYQFACRTDDLYSTQRL